MTLKVAIRPKSLRLNRFVDLFAAALGEAGHEPVEYEEKLSSLLGYDAIVLHWPDEFLGPARRRDSLLKLARIWLARQRGTRLVWVAHNRATHAGPAASALVPHAFVRQLDGIVYLSEASRRIVREAYPVPDRTRELVTVHGTYPPIAPPTPFRPPVAGAPVDLVNVGMIKRYKGIETLVEALPGDGSLHLTVAGMRHDDALAGWLADEAGRRPDLAVRIEDAPIADAELEAIVDRAHAVVLPYREILNSGAALFALSRNRPVLVPALGSMPELRDAVGAAWVHLFDPPLDGAALARFVASVRDETRGNAPDLARFDWTGIAVDLRLFLDDLCQKRKRRTTTAQSGRNSTKDQAIP